MFLEKVAFNNQSNEENRNYCFFSNQQIYRNLIDLLNKLIREFTIDTDFSTKEKPPNHLYQSKIYWISRNHAKCWPWNLTNLIILGKQA